MIHLRANVDYMGATVCDGEMAHDKELTDFIELATCLDCKEVANRINDECDANDLMPTYLQSEGRRLDTGDKLSDTFWHYFSKIPSEILFGAAAILLACAVLMALFSGLDFLFLEL